jgi:hypothetical protein
MSRYGYSLKQAVVAVLVAVMLVLSAAPARAARLEVVFKDGLWGAAIGALLGIAQVSTFKKPENETYRIGQGAALGIVLGVAFGFAEAGGAFASYDREQNQLAIGVPAVQVTRDAHGDRVMMSLVDAKF